MPTVPVYGNPKVSTALLPSARRSAAATPQSEGVGAWNAVADLGQAAAAVGLKLLKEDQDRQDQTALTTAERQFGQLELQVKERVLTKKGLDALAEKDPAMEALDQQLGMIESNLNDRQKRAFQPFRDRRRLQIEADIDGHGLRERVVHEEKEAQAGIETAINLAGHNATDPRRIAEAIASIDRIVDAPTNPLQITGAEARKIVRAGAYSKVHEVVIASLLAKDLDIKAREYFEEVRDQLSAAVLPRIETQVTEGSSQILAARTADEIWAHFAPIDDRSPIDIDKMEADARTRFADQPKVAGLVRELLRERALGVKDGRRERASGLLDAVWGGYISGATLQQTMASKAFKAMPTDEQFKIIEQYRRAGEHAESLANSRAQRAYADEGRALQRLERQLKLQEINGHSRYADLVSNPSFAEMKVGEVRAEFGNLGPTLWNRFYNEWQQEQNAKDGRARAVTIDATTLKAVLNEGGQTWVNKPKQTTTDKANLNAVRLKVLDELAKRQASQKTPLSTEEKLEVARGVVDNSVMVDDWFSDSEVVAATVKPDDRKAVYVPLDQIDATSGAYKQALNYLRGTSAAAARLTDAQLRTQYKARIEKAIGRARTGGSREEIENALKGVD